MKQQIIFTLLLLLIFPYQANAISLSVKQKYPYVLLTDDHGILNEKDLKFCGMDIKPRPFSPKDSLAQVYWQCFPREDVAIFLEDFGYSAPDIGGEENYGYLSITVHKLGENVFHQYGMRRAFAVDGYEEQFNLWRKLMKKQKYVCLAGSFISKDEKIVDGKKQYIYAWTFEKIKTKKGHDSYFLEGAKLAQALR